MMHISHDTRNYPGPHSEVLLDFPGLPKLMLRELGSTEDLIVISNIKGCPLALRSSLSLIPWVIFFEVVIRIVALLDFSWCKIHLKCFLITNVDVDEASKRRYSEKLSYVEDGLLSAYSPSSCDMGVTRLHGTSSQATRVVRNLSRQSTEGSLEMETAFNNRGFEDSYATDSSSVWSPEASYFCLFSSCSGVGSPWLTLYPLQLPPPSSNNLSKKGIFL